MTFPPEVQKTVLAFLDYPSLCMLRSTSRYWYNFLTEVEIQDAFLNIDIVKGDTSKKPEEGGACTHCSLFCDATKAQVKKKAEKDVKDEEEIKRTKELLLEARRRRYTARVTTSNARASLKRVKENLKADRQAKVDDAVASFEEAKEDVKAARDDADVARRAKWIDMDPEIARTCDCKRLYNGYRKPGLLEVSPKPSTSYFTYTMSRSINNVCTRKDHYTGRPTSEQAYANMQQDGKICKICWKGTSRGTSGKQRRMVFVEDYGYWMRETWLAGAKAIKNETKRVAKMSLEQIEEKQKLEAIKEEEADAIKAEENVIMGNAEADEE